MILLEQVQALQLGVGLGEGEDRRVAGCDGFDLGIGEFLTADVLGAAGGVVARYHLRDEPSLGFEGLPHISIE